MSETPETQRPPEGEHDGAQNLEEGVHHDFQGQATGEPGVDSRPHAELPEFPAGTFAEVETDTTDEQVADEPSEAGDPGDDSSVLNADTEARIEELRSRGRVGVLTEGTERPDASKRMKNSDHDPDAIAVVNKANRLRRQQIADRRRQEYNDDTRIRIGANFRRATNAKLDKVAEDDDLRQYFEDPDGWEVGMRRMAKEEGVDQWIEKDLQFSKEIRDSKLADIGRYGDNLRGRWLSYAYEDLNAVTQVQDQYRGDLLELYARDPERYKSMSTEEFVAMGHEFRNNSSETSRLASLELWGRVIEEKLPQLVESASSIGSFCKEMDDYVLSLRYGMDNHGIGRDNLYRFVEAVEGKVSPMSFPEDEADRTPEFMEAYEKADEVRQDTERKMGYIDMHGYFRPGDFVTDLDRPPREQMKEAVERAKVVTSEWIAAGEKSREEFDKKWGKAPDSKEPEPSAS